MTDTMTPEQRHRCMSHIHSRNTRPELLVRRWLWRHGYRYRLNVKTVPGKADIVLRTYRTAIFVNGCFWHGHGLKWKAVGEKWDAVSSACCKIPRSNREFWVGKIRRNQERDERNYALLQSNGWQVIVVWECQLTSARLDRTMQEVAMLLEENLLAQYRHRPLRPYTFGEEESALPMAAEPEE